MKKYNRFDLEAAIMEAWHTKDDISMVYHGSEEMTEDELMNALLGVEQLCELRFNKLWAIFEYIVGNYDITPLKEKENLTWDTFVSLRGTLDGD
jgi:hypothetical protein